VRRSGAETEKGREEMEAKNETVSVLHKDHCPLTGDGDGDNHWNGSGGGDKNQNQNQLEQLKTLCEFRERQVIRAEETIGGLSKDKRALNHQIGLMRTEMIQMKANEEELQKKISKITKLLQDGDGEPVCTLLLVSTRIVVYI
jgi:septal ring factor EnvC (AmiA/AmiB activator)